MPRVALEAYCVAPLPCEAVGTGDGDARFLRRSFAYSNYTNTPALGVPGEGECLGEQEQARLSARAKRAWAERRRAAWRDARGEIDTALDRFLVTANGDVRVAHSARAIRRACDALGRTL